jgi:predicted phage-related endonuclease
MFTAEDAAKIGGSDLAAIMGLSQWSTPLAVYARVVSALEGRYRPDKADAYQSRGNIMERAVLEVYAERTGARLLPGPKLTHPDMPWVRASLDALAERDGVIVADAKTIAASERHHFGTEGTDEVRQDILFQMNLYVGIGLRTGHVTRPVADVPVLGLNGADPVVFTIGYDPELFGMLEQAVERFWKDHVLPRRPPPVTEPLRDVDAIGALYPRHSGNERHWETFASEEQRIIFAYLHAKDAAKAAKKAEAEAEAALKLMLKDTPKVYGLPPSTGAKSLTWKQSKPGTTTDWRAVAGELSDLNDSVVRSIIAKHTTTKEGARPLRVTATKEEE